MNYDEYLNHLSKKENADLCYASLVSLFPFFPLSLKLLERKNRGKKPFSIEFCYDEKKKIILDTEKYLMDALDKEDFSKEELKKKLAGFSSILSEAKEETKNQGLKNDFDYMIKEIRNVTELF